MFIQDISAQGSQNPPERIQLFVKRRVRPRRFCFPQSLSFRCPNCIPANSNVSTPKEFSTKYLCLSFLTLLLYERGSGQFLSPVGGCARARKKKKFIPTSPIMGGGVPPLFLPSTVTAFLFSVTVGRDHALAFG